METLMKSFESEEAIQTVELSDEQNDELQVSKMLAWMMPWIEKTDGEQTIGYWQDTLPTVMMVNLLEMWLTEESRERLRKMLQMYHPLDRAAMAYALLTYVMTGHKMTFKSVVAQQHYAVMIEAIKMDMPCLSFAGHMKYMMQKYGTKKHV